MENCGPTLKSGNCAYHITELHPEWRYMYREKFVKPLVVDIYAQCWRQCDGNEYVSCCLSGQHIKLNWMMIARD